MVIPRTDPVQPDAPRARPAVPRRDLRYLDPRRLVTTEVFLRGLSTSRSGSRSGIDVVAGMTRRRGARGGSDGAAATFLSPLPPDGAQTLEDVDHRLCARRSRRERRKGWPLRKRVVALELEAVASRVEGVLFVNSVLRRRGAPAPAQRRSR